MNTFILSFFFQRTDVRYYFHRWWSLSNYQTCQHIFFILIYNHEDLHNFHIPINKLY
uniref:Uncharacterized protein n=1 Tax=Lepeophtheirus salmonis TaxID=72036 RepID=A0A0K2V7V9_LEPSM